MGVSCRRGIVVGWLWLSLTPTSPLKTTAVCVYTGHRSPEPGERPMAGSDEDS